MATKLATILADFQTTLSTEIAIGGTTATLSSATDDDSVALPSGRYFFTLDNSNASKEHISCDLVGTALTNIKSLSRQGVETTGTVRKHRIGASVTLTDFGHIKFINDLVSGATTLNSSAPLGYDGAPSSLTGNQLATVTYVLGVVNGGAVTFDQQIISNQTSGEALAINDLVYFKESDARWYKVDADLTTTFDGLQTGINKTTAAGAGITIQVAISGPVSGFSGLTAGSKYYASNTAGAITTTAGTYSVFVGWALTTTILLFNAEGKTLPTQKEKDALVGSQGIASSTNKYVTQDNTTSAGTDQSQTTQNGTVEVGEADATTKKNKIAQSFIPSKTKMRGVNLYKSADTGTFTGTVTISLQADTSGSPSGSDLATVTITNANWLLKAVGSFEALFGTEYTTLTAGSLYWIVITTSTSDNSNHPNLGTNTAGGYSSGSVKYNNTTDSWVAIATIDLYFKTLEGDISQVVKTGTDGYVPSTLLDPVTQKYLVGTLANDIIKTYFNMQLAFILWVGAVVNDTTTTSPNWLRSGNATQVNVQPGGAITDFASTGAASLSVKALGAVIGIDFDFSRTNIVICDFWAKFQSTSTGDISMGFADNTTSFSYEQAYNSTLVNRVMFTRKGTGELYATISKAGVGVTNTDISTGVTQTIWNNYRIELDLSNNALFYINGILRATLSGTNFPNSNTNNGIHIGFGRNNDALFTVSAPTLSLEMNP